MTPIQEPQEIEIPRGVVAEASAPLPVIQFPDGSTEPAPAGSVKAEDIIGLITSEQIEELEAAKIGGKLTAEQIENVHAASIIGEIINSQIKGMGVGKLEGQVTAAQIAANSITAEKIAVGAVITEKIAAGAITTGKLAAEAITAEKISASAITTSKIAAGAITVEKLTVAELSGITPKLGTITAGTIEGTAIRLTENKEEVPEVSRINWRIEGKVHNWIGSFSETNVSNMRLVCNSEYLRKESEIEIRSATKQLTAAIQLIAEETESSIALRYGKSPEKEVLKPILSEKLLIDTAERSDYLQLSDGPANATIVWGSISASGVGESGFGYSVTHPTTGVYSVFFSFAFAGTPSVVVSPNAGAGESTIFTVEEHSTGHFTVEAYNLSGGLKNSAFSFIAVGGG